MRLYALRRHFGLKWKTSIPPIPWRIIVDSLLLISIMVLALVLTDYITRAAVLADANAKAVYRTDKAEINLISCLNGKTLVGDDRSMVMCDPFTQKL